MTSIDQKRVYSARTGTTAVFVATSSGLVRIECSAGRVGEFGLVARCSSTDITSHEGVLAVGTHEDVLIGGRDDEPLETTGFGPANAVGYHEGTLIAAGDGEVARYDGTEWETIGSLSDVRSIDGPLIAAESGVHRITENDIVSAGLEDVRDVAAVGGVPIAGTSDGIYQLGNGWMKRLDGAVSLLTTDRKIVYAVVDGSLFVCATPKEDSEWRPVELPEPIKERAARIVALAPGEPTYSVTEDGTFLVRDEGEWRFQSIGLTAVCGLAVL